MYTTRKRRLIQETHESENDNYKFIERKNLIKLLYKPINKVKELSPGILNRVIDEYPVLSSIYTIFQKFKEALFSKNPETLNNWIKEVKLLNILDINSFINGIENDIEGVENSIIYEYSNGLAEGKVNKIKVIKRIMYGRCKFETLRNTVLSLENS
ncbi:transposase [Clostridium tunisiense]|uniref:transposase n=1 Tax=Clostridium tunisiense TaxID=219748 RepID=UPI0002DF8086|nr:transposase [Clostridium tunisiense]